MQLLFWLLLAGACRPESHGRWRAVRRDRPGRHQHFRYFPGLRRGRDLHRYRHQRRLLRLENISLPALTIDDTKPLTIDVVTTDIGGKSTQQLAIGLPAITGDVTVGAIKVGDTSAASIGSLTVSGLNMAGSTIKVWGH